MKLDETIAIFLTFLSITTIVAMEFVSNETLPFLLFLDFVFAAFLILDFVLRVRKKGKGYFLLNFYEIFAYIPAVVLLYFVPPHLAAFFRSLRVIRIIALGIRLIKEISAKSAKLLGSAVLLLFTTIILGSISFYIAEGESRSLSFFDCVYWAVVTITTVGYGDLVPITSLGKLISMIIVLLGISVVSLFTASILSAIMSEKESGLKEELEKLIEKHEKKAKDENEKRLIRKLREVLEKS